MTLFHIRAALAGLFCLCASLCTAAPTVSFTTAKAKAAREGKVLLVDFTATWCMPCRWMDETTFSDRQVLSYLREHYVSIKIDIDDFDGFALKQQYGVHSLPTLLFFSTDGQPVHRIEEGIGAAEMLAALQDMNQADYRRITSTEQAIGEDWTEPFARMENVYAAEDPTAPVHYIAQRDEAQTAVAERTLPQRNTNDAPASRMPMSVPALETRCLSNVLAEADPLPTHLAVATVRMPAESIPDEPRMTPADVRIFSLQAGAFSNQANAVRAADHLREYTESPVLIEFDAVNEKPVYRIYVGRFVDMADAEAVSKRLHLHGFSCIPKQLAMQ